MEPIKTHSMLGSIDGLIGVFHEMIGERKPLKNEQFSNDAPYIQYANARNLPELMSALDAIFWIDPYTDFLVDYTALRDPAPLDQDMTQEIATFFDPQTPTRTTLEKTRAAIEAWNMDSSKEYMHRGTITTYDEDGNEVIRKAPPMWAFSPLEDIIFAQKDLRRTSLLLAWLLGKTDFQTAHGLSADDRKAKMRTINEKEPKHLAKYYEKLKKNTGNLWAGMNTGAAVQQIHLYRERDIESTVASYVEGVFTLLLSDERKIVNSNMYVETLHLTHLSGAYAYLAEGLCKESGPGAIGVCRHCHRFFEQQRSTKQFCSDSCRVMYQRRHADGSEPEPVMPHTMVMEIHEGTR